MGSCEGLHRALGYYLVGKDVTAPRASPGAGAEEDGKEVRGQRCHCGREMPPPTESQSGWR